MTLFEEIIESCLPEGGSAVDGASPILGADAKKINSEVLSRFKAQFPDVEIGASGSSSRADDDDECGDIDFTVGKSFDEADDVIQWINKTFPGDSRTFHGLHVCSVSFPYKSVNGEDKIAQIDFNFTNNFGFTQSLKSGVRKSETQFKNMVKNSLLKILAKVAPVDGEGYEDVLYTGDEFDGSMRDKFPQFIGQPKEKWRFSLGDTGLSLAHRTSMGVKKPRTRKVRGSDSDEPVLDFGWNGSVLDRQSKTSDFMEAMKLILGNEVTMEDTLSVERLIAYLFSGKYPYATPERMEEIKEKMHNHLIEDFERPSFPEGTAQQLTQLFDSLWDKYSGGQSLNENRIAGFKMTDLLRRMH